jgi:misacylated tRNA(Ala) deacylase
MLFIENPYLKEFDAKIVNINTNQITLDQTAFYARSGGQPGDVGRLTTNEMTINIIDTIKDQKNNIIHIAENNIQLEIGEKIQGIINLNKRYKHMRMHTALHLLCSVIPLDVTGGQIGYDKSRLDFNAQDYKIEKEEIENNINSLVKKDHEISYQWITNDELEQQPELVRTMSVQPPKIKGEIRLVKIGNVDLQPCGGTHVKNTAEIGEIKIGKIENKGKMNRRVNILIND